ncbi:MAG: winged helix-turn-helix protein [Frankiales bacterium]|nr:winged helix-turn-helix protein [Frankiales bacterium]
MEQLSLAQARRVALAAQGFTDPLPPGSPDRRHLRRVLRRTLLLQIDSVNVLERAHYLPAFSRLGAYDKGLVDGALARRELFEYWGHEASLLPVALHPLLRWRMERARRLEEGWGGPLRAMRERPDFVASVLERVREQGPVGAGELREGPRRGGAWWDWDEAKVALEYLFWSGEVTTHSRRGFERLYDLTERVLPAAVLDLPTPARADAQRELLRLSAVAQGIGTAKSLRDHFRLRPEADTGLQDLVDAGELTPVRVEGRTWYLAAGAALPRRVRRDALLSPFDPLVWERSRTEALFGFRYRIEIYVPAAKRVHGYYVLPFLHDEQLAARVDLKADRQAGVLRVLGVYAEGTAPPTTAAALAEELRRLAGWQGLADVVVERRGDLAPALTRELAGSP